MKKLVIILTLFATCEFRMSDEDAREELNESVSIQFGDLEVGERNIHYAFSGNKRDFMIVFLHGSPGSWNAFIDFFKIDSLVKEFDVLAVDRPGFGNSGYGVSEPSLEKQAFLINEVLNQFPNKKKILIGHSLGGPIAARMAMDYPKAYHGMILVAPSIDPDMEEDQWYRSVIDTKFGAFFTPKEFEVSNSEILLLKDELELMEPLWYKIKIPTIVIHGSDDSLVPKENAAFAKRVLPDSMVNINMLEGVNHFIPWTHPQEILKAINQLTDGL
ncbi:alpha/beta fold hydrolase [Ekhidna sp.]|uniref:alpha/beta fold hydrolase n=1 Tax=Ekhidna sp. TaxID=2608089 RepID=UPI003C7CAEDF